MSEDRTRSVRGIRFAVAGSVLLAWVSARGEPGLVVAPAEVPVGGEFTARVEGAGPGASVRWQAGRNAQLYRIDSFKRQAVFKGLSAGTAEVSAVVGNSELKASVRVGSAAVVDGGVGKGAVAPVKVTETRTGTAAGGTAAGGTAAGGTAAGGTAAGGTAAGGTAAGGTAAGGRDRSEKAKEAAFVAGPDVFRLPELPAAEAVVPPPIDLDSLDRAQWAGCVSAAREAMRLVYGKMSPEEEKKFDKRWKAALEFPNREVVAYFNKLNPLLARFLALRRAAAQTLLAMDYAQYEAAVCVAYKDATGMAERMRGLAMLRAHLASVGKGIEAVSAEIEALGEMPDAAAAQETARKRHRAAMAMFAGGSGLQGEWVGTVKREKIEGDLDVIDTFSEVLFSGSVLEAMKKAAEEKMTPEQREAAQLAVKRKEEAWAAGTPIAPDLADKFPEHLIFTPFETDRGEKVFHLYNFGSSDLKREDYEKSGRLKDYEFNRAACDRWMGTRNFIWPEFDEGSGFWKLEQESRNPTGWREKWVWEFDVEGDSLTITEKGYYAEGRTDMGGHKDLGGKMRCHRVWELRRVARDPNAARPADWSLEEAVREIRHPSSAWVLKGAEVKPQERALAAGESVDVSKDALSVTLTYQERKWVPAPSSGGGANTIMAAEEEDSGRAGSEVLIPCVSKHTLAKAPPQKLRPGEGFDLEATVAIEPPKEGDDFHFEAHTRMTDHFTREGMLGVTKSVEGSTGPGPASGSVKHRCPGVPDWPYNPEHKVVIEFSGWSRPSFEIHFVYEPVPLELADQVDAQVKVVGAGKQSGGPAGPDPAQVEQIKFHENNIDYFKAQVARIEGELGGSADPGAKQELERRLLYAKDAMQRELDQIHYVKTGEYVHTRTEADEFNRKLMAEQSRQMAEHFGTLHRVIERMPRLIATAPPGEQDALRKRFFEVVNSKSIASGDLGDIRKVADEIGERIGGLRRKEMEKAENELWWADAKVTALEVTKGAADFTLMVSASIAFAPVVAAAATTAEIAAAAQGLALFTGYAAFTTGYMDGNPAGAVKQVLAGVTLTGALADQVIQGYQAGVVNAYEQYARDTLKANLPGAKPGAGPGAVDEVSAGLTQAAWEGGKALVLMGAMKLGIHWLCDSPPSRPQFKIEGGRSAKNFKGGTQVEGWMSMEEFTQLEAFRRAQTVGQQRAEQFQAMSEQYWALHNKLRAGGASLRDVAENPELRVLQRRMTESYSQVKADYHAKVCLNQSGNAKVLSHYNKIDTMQMQKVRGRLGELMDQQGFSKQEYRLYSNSASSGRAGLDVDLGMVEPRGSPPEFGKWLGTLTQTENGVTRRVSLDQIREAGQRNLRAAFREVMGQEMDEPFLLFTHSRHPEAYKDLAWLGTDKVKHVVVDGIQPGWTQQAASVSRFKIDELHGLPGLDRYTKLQESCRGLVKDFDTKLAPLLKRGSNPEAVTHMGELCEVMRRFSRNEIGPVDADRQIRLLTGGRGVADIAERFRVMLEGLGGGMAR